MKRFFLMLAAVPFFVGMLSACAKSQAAGEQQSVPIDGPVAIIVMDSTQALLPYVHVAVGKDTFVTSYDGRVVLKPECLQGATTVSISCESFLSQTLPLSALSASPLLVTLIEDKNASYPIGYGKPGPIYDPSEDLYVMDAEEDVHYSYMAMEKPSIARHKDAALRSTKTATLSEPKAESYSKNIGAGKLTAGEVNDFTKWNLWDSYQQSAISYQQTWRMYPRNRYTVQVTNSNGYPIVNYPVSLTDEQGNTLFQAVTDNTGKAELWANLIVDGKRVKVKEPEKHIIVDEPCPSSVTDDQSLLSEVSSDVDIVFVFDATGSMGDELDYLQAEMKDVIARAKEATGGLAIRTGAVVYRDHGDDYITRISRLTGDISVTQSFIDKQRAFDGGDYPEAVPEALMAALNSSGWNPNARARIAFLVLDAPCHDDSVTLALLHDQILNAAAQGVRIVPVVCSGIGDDGEFLMRTIALATNGTSFFLTDDSGIGFTHHKPTTDTLKVEHLNDMLVRTIVEFSYMPACEPEALADEPEPDETFIPNPFDAKDLEQDPTIPHGAGVHYVLDVSGKLLGIFEGEITNSQIPLPNVQLPVGVYFIKTYIDGQWYTKKVLL